jgi:stage V sporulation protein D (sporulation-specific penicillin-binding protein)
MKNAVLYKKSAVKKNQTNLLYNPSKRLLAVVLLAVFLFAAVFVKLFFVMVVNGEKLQIKAVSQWMRDVPTEAARGKILDKNGVVLAATATRYNIYVRPNSVSDKSEMARLLVSVFGYNYDDILKKISKSASEVTVATGATKDQMTSLYASGLSGIYYAEDNLRYYPYGDFMTQVLGFTGADNNGQTGLEAYYDKYLCGINGQILSETDLIGRNLGSGNDYYIPAVNGMNLVTTLDAGIQRIVEAAVGDAVAKFNPKGVACAVMDYTNGEIVALAEYPSFDLNNVPRDNLEQLFLNSKSKLVSTVFEPGSTFKILTAAAALDSGAVSVSDRFYCSGYEMVDGQRIKCWKHKGHGSVTFAQGVLESCNVVFMNSALRMGTSVFYEYLRNFGLNVKTGVDLSGETAGLMIAQNSVKSVDLARIGFGQAVAVTPIGLLAATSSVINGGTKVTPHLVNYITNDYNSQIIDLKAALSSSEGVISKSTSDTMRGLLSAVVTSGSGKAAYNAGYQIAGKTGTAQKYGSDGAIAQGKYISSFIGFSLTEGANYGIIFMVDEPQGYLYYGSLVAAPLVGQIYKNIFAYLGIDPVYTGNEAEITGTPFALSDYSGMSVVQAMNALKKLGLHVETSGEGSVVTAQYPLSGVTVDKRNTVLLIT